MRENVYQQIVADKIYDLFHPEQPLSDIIVYIADPNYIQGIPDLFVFYRPTGRTAWLEVKLSEESREQPNQRYYVEHWGQTIFTAFIYPANEEEVLGALRETLRA